MSQDPTDKEFLLRRLLAEQHGTGKQLGMLARRIDKLETFVTGIKDEQKRAADALIERELERAKQRITTKRAVGIVILTSTLSFLLMGVIAPAVSRLIYPQNAPLQAVKEVTKEATKEATKEDNAEVLKALKVLSDRVEEISAQATKSDKRRAIVKRSRPSSELRFEFKAKKLGEISNWATDQWPNWRN